MAARDVTGEEIAFYRENGWAKLPCLIDPNRAREVLAACKDLLAEMEEAIASGSSKISIGKHGERQYLADDLGAAWFPFLLTVRHIRREPFRSLALDPSLGRVAYRMIDRARLGAAQVPVALSDANLLVKFPAGAECSKATRYHQDNAADIGMDRVGHVNMWIALEEVTPEQGTMRFLSGSHREGPLGKHRDTMLEEYPALTEMYPWSEPLHYMPGDATVQHDFTIHGAPENMTDRIRWGFVCSYIAADCDVERDAPLSLGLREPYGTFPIVYPV
jgi:hypothetical protein